MSRFSEVRANHWPRVASTILTVCVLHPIELPAEPDPYLSLYFGRSGSRELQELFSVSASPLQAGDVPQIPLRINDLDISSGGEVGGGKLTQFAIVFSADESNAQPHLRGPFPYGTVSFTLGSNGKFLVASDARGDLLNSNSPDSFVQPLFVDDLTLHVAWVPLFVQSEYRLVARTQIEEEISGLTLADVNSLTLGAAPFVANRHNSLAAFATSTGVHVVNVETKKVIVTAVRDVERPTYFGVGFAGESTVGIVESDQSKDSPLGKETAFVGMSIGPSGAVERCRSERLPGRATAVFGSNEGAALTVVTQSPYSAYSFDCGDQGRAGHKVLPLKSRGSVSNTIWSDRFATAHDRQVDYYSVRASGCTLERTALFPTIDFESAAPPGIALSGAEVVLLQDPLEHRHFSAHFSDGRELAGLPFGCFVPTRDGGVALLSLSTASDRPGMRVVNLYRLER